MEDTLLFLILCIDVQDPVVSHSLNQTSHGVTSAFEASLLTLVAANTLFCIITAIAVCLLFRHVRKIWIKFSRKNAVLEGHIEENAPGVPDSCKPEKDNHPTNSQTPTLSSSVHLPACDKQESFWLSKIPPRSHASTLELLTQKTRHSTTPERCTKEHNFTVVDLTRDDDSGYVDMRSCYVSAPLFSTVDEGIYDIPQYASASHLYSVQRTQRPASLIRPKHSRYFSDPSSYTSSLAQLSFGRDASKVPNAARDAASKHIKPSSTISLQAAGPELTFRKDTSKSEKHFNGTLKATREEALQKQKTKLSVSSPKQQPIDI